MSTFQCKFNRVNLFSCSWDISRRSFYSCWCPDISVICCRFCTSHICIDSPHLGFSSATWSVKIGLLVVEIQAEWSLWQFLRPKSRQRHKTNTQLFQETSAICKGNVGQWNPRKSNSRWGVKAPPMDNRIQKLSYSSNIKRTRTVSCHYAPRKMQNLQSNPLSKTSPSPYPHWS